MASSKRLCEDMRLSWSSCHKRNFAPCCRRASSSPRLDSACPLQHREPAIRGAGSSILCSRKLTVRSQPRELTQDVSDSMEKVLEQHARRITELVKELSDSEKYLVLIAGGPGSGKTSSAHVTCQLLNRLGESSSVQLAVVAPMDGFHYYRRQLDEMENPDEAHARRGAPWTFDAAAFVKAISDIREKGEASLPSFDHAAGDPIPDDIQILRSHRVVLIEGNYVLLDEEPWRKLAEIADESWFISCSLDAAMDRVIARQVGNGIDLETAQWRVANNDRPNAQLMQQSAVRATHVIPSLPYKDPERGLPEALGPEE